MVAARVDRHRPKVNEGKRKRRKRDGICSGWLAHVVERAEGGNGRESLKKNENVERRADGVVPKHIPHQRDRKSVV